MLLLATTLLAVSAQDYDDEGYGPQGGGGGGGGQGEADNYAGGGGSGNGYDDGYNANMPGQYQNVDSDGSSNSPSGYPPQGGSDADGDYEGDDGTAAAAASESKLVRLRRSADNSEAQLAPKEPVVRVKRHSKYIGPVYTYVKTDKHAHFKWGVSRWANCCAALCLIH